MAAIGGDTMTSNPAGSNSATTGSTTEIPTTTGRISVCLVDDQTLVRQGIRSLLELSDDIRIVGEAADGVQAMELIPKTKPDVVLLDMRMPGMSGLDVLNALAAKGDMPPTIILTTFDDDQLVLAGLKAGARGYLLKDVSLEQLVDAVKAVASGGSLVQPVVTQRLLAGLERMHNDFTSLDRPDPLTERETEILRLMAGGYSNKEIANSLGVAEGTVKNHVSNILSKLGVRDRTRAVLKAFEIGIV
jgi:DNA-binding NarL/FixJ family response regulator